MITQQDLIDQLDFIQASPTETGTVKMLVIRPETDAREIKQEAYFTPEGGIEGDRWKPNPEKYPNNQDQLAIMNSRVLSFIADHDPDRMALAGDQMVVDFNLNESNVPAGTKLQIGEAEFEVTPMLHKGCKKFAARFGAEALKYINAPANRPLHMRGVYLRTTKAGKVKVGDSIQKL